MAGKAISRVPVWVRVPVVIAVVLSGVLASSTVWGASEGGGHGSAGASQDGSEHGGGQSDGNRHGSGSDSENNHGSGGTGGSNHGLGPNSAPSGAGRSPAL